MENKITIEPKKTIMLEKANNGGKVDTSKLFEDIEIAIEKWAQACIDKDEIPVCVSGFLSINSKEDEACIGKNIIIGEPEEIMPILKHMNQLLTS